MDRSTDNMCAKVFEALLNFAIKEQTLRERMDLCTQRKNDKVKAKVFKVLVCPEFYMSKEPLKLEECEKFRVKRVFEAWKELSARES